MRPALRASCLTLATLLAVAPVAARAAPATDAALLDAAFLDALTWGVSPASHRGAARQGPRALAQEQLHPPARPAPAGGRAGAGRRADAEGHACSSGSPPSTRRRKAANAEPDPEAQKAAQQAYQEALHGRGPRRRRGCDPARALLPDQLQEQMTWFWMNHFNVHQDKANLRAMVGDYEDTRDPPARARAASATCSSATAAPPGDAALPRQRRRTPPAASTRTTRAS